MVDNTSSSKKLSLRAVQLQKAIEKQKKLDKYLQEVQEYFEFIAEEDEDENLEREDYWAQKELNGFQLKDFTHDAEGKEIHFKGNADVKPPKCALPFTQEHVDEFVYCSYHPIYTITNYFKIVSEDRGIIPFDLYDFQKTLIRNVFKNTRNLALFARQSGKSICVAAIMLFYCMFNKNKTLGIISLKRAGAIEILDRIKTIYLNLPMWLKPAISKWNNGSIEFANGCKIIASATTGASIRGKSLAFLYIDEICFIPRKLWDSFYKSTFPVISASKLAKIVITTTPNGKDHFYYMWQDALKGKNGYTTQKVIWTQVPGRDEIWRQGALADVGHDELAFRQEYEVEFLGASLEYIKLKTLESVESSIKPPLYADPATSLYIFEQPIENHDYCIAVDVSEGKGKDYNAVNVIDVSQMPLKIVASLKNNQIDSIELAPIIYHLCEKYNEAFLMIENNLSDLAKDLWYNYEYTNMLNFNLSKSEFRQPKKIEVGLKTTSKVRRIGEEYFKHMVENDKIILNDIRLVKELNNLEYNELKKRFVPRDENINDDLWSSMKIFSYIAKTYYFEAMLKNGKALANLLISNSKENGEEPLPFILRPVTISSTTDESSKKKSKVLDRAEKRWKNAQSWV